MPDMEKKTDDLVVETTNSKVKDSNIDHDDITVKTPNSNTTIHKSSRNVKEKVIFKVVPVPYYYPVPVDAEWYYKHYEPPTLSLIHI